MDSNGLKIPALWENLINNLNEHHVLELQKAERLKKEIDGPPVSEVLQEKQVNYGPWTQVEKLYAYLEQLDEHLEAERESYRKQCDQISERWKNVKMQQILLNLAFQNLSLYFQACREQRQDYMKQKKECEEITRTQNLCIRRLTKELKALKQLKEELITRLEKYSMVKNFIETVQKENAQNFEEIEDIEDRFKVLQNIRTQKARDLITLISDRVETHDKNRITTNKEEDKSFCYQQHLHDLRIYFKKAELLNVRLEDNLWAARAKCTHNILFDHKQKTGIQNLYRLLCEQMGEPAKIQEQDYVKQLKKIRKFLPQVEKLRTTARHEYSDGDDVSIVPQPEKNLKFVRNAAK